MVVQAVPQRAVAKVQRTVGDSAHPTSSSGRAQPHATFSGRTQSYGSMPGSLGRSKRPASQTVQAVTEISARIAKELADHSPYYYQSPLSAGDMLLRHHSAGWYGAICAASITLGVSGAILFQLMWKVMEKIVVNSDQETAEWLALHGIDVPTSSLLALPEVIRAANFAAVAHKGQVRKTKEPYVIHCLETALIVEALMAPFLETVRARTAVICAVLHDVVDDTQVSVEEVKDRFGSEVADITSKVSQLSTLNQLLRRQKRRLEQDEGERARQNAVDDSQIRHLILSMVDEPLVILIKLADRLHNMRTIYALKPEKQKAVAHETLDVWCSLAERLGMFAMKAELEDLCFAVLEPETYYNLYTELQDFWENGPGGQAAYHDGGSQQLIHTFDSGISFEGSGQMSTTSQLVFEGARDPDMMFRLLRTVPRFEEMTFSSGMQSPGPMPSGLVELQTCARQLLQELSLESHAAGLDITFQGRLKSVYSVHAKMKKKGVGVEEIYDARALRIIVDDIGGKREAAAIAACYRLLPAVHRLWRPVWGETDDYIANPKGSGYQSLHTAVLGPRNIPLEIQIRTASMHQMAEYGQASHWVYKEGFTTGSNREMVKAEPRNGQALLRIDDGKLRDGVVIKATNAGKVMLCATFMGGRLSTDGTRPCAGDYRDLLDYVEHKGWFEAGHGDSRISLENFILCSDQQYHRIDHCGHVLPTRIQLLDMPKETLEERGWGTSRTPGSAATGTASAANQQQQQMKEKISLLRSMLEWGWEVEDQAGVDRVDNREVMVLLWPKGSIARYPRGTTAGQILESLGTLEILADSGSDLKPIRFQGPASALVNVNNRLVPETYTLDDGDMVILSRSLLIL